MRRLVQSGLVFALVSVFSACSGGGSVPESRMSAATGGGSASASTSRPARVFLYSFITLNIPALPAQLDILERQLVEWQFEVDRSVDPVVFTDQSLAKYAAV